MCRIGLIADTHGLFRPAIAELFAGVDLIVHAGDVGGGGVLEALIRIAPVEAVSGNVDDPFDPALPRERMLPVGGLMLHVSHGDELGRPTPGGLLARYSGDILVFGHTHRPLSTASHDGRLVVNPGSAGPRRFSLPVGVARLTIDNRVPSVEFLSLA
jgi:putative phosphoesterase